MGFKPILAVGVGMLLVLFTFGLQLVESARTGSGLDVRRGVVN